MYTPFVRKNDMFSIPFFSCKSVSMQVDVIISEGIECNKSTVNEKLPSPTNNTLSPGLNNDRRMLVNNALEVRRKCFSTL